MKRGLAVLALGMIGTVVAYLCVYRMGTARPRAMMQSSEPELAWLRHEFDLGDAEFRRISELHAGYLPRCRERCRRIDALNDHFSNTLATAIQVTPEVEELLHERARMRAACQAEMLRHFFEVSRAMPPEQGRRYLAWVRGNTCLREQAIDHGPDNHAAMPPSDEHP